MKSFQSGSGSGSGSGYGLGWWGESQNSMCLREFLLEQKDHLLILR
jgi:hypothetical protein